MPERSLKLLSIEERAAVTRALDDYSLDVDLRALIGRRAWLFYVEQAHPVNEAIRFVVVQGGDTVEVINETLGFAVTGKDAEEPSYDWIEHHGLWFEIAYVRSGDSDTFIYVENNPGVELGIHDLCLSYFWPDR